MKRIALLLFLTINLNSIFSQNVFVTNPDQLDDPDFAEWVSPPNISGHEYGVYYFRKIFNIAENPEQFIINVSADNRYRLFVNEKMVCFGPAVGDLNNWNYERIDIADYLVEGENIIAAQVWNFGAGKGARQISNRTAFILQGDRNINFDVNTNSSWKVIKDEAYSPIFNSSSNVGGGYIAGSTEMIDGRKLNRDWNKLELDDSNWLNAISIGKGNHKGLNTWLGTPWLLKERTIPFMQQEKQTIPSVCFVHGIEYDLNSYKEKLELEIPANSKVEILLDNKVLTMGYPVLSLSGGKGSSISIQYQECLFNSDGKKGNRDEWQNKEMKGYKDVFIADGENNRNFEPLWIRVFRYAKLTIETSGEALKLNDFYNMFTAFPLEQKAGFSSNDNSLNRIWDVSWRTARLCALENYMDCPYYEQLQYIGDTRIQALISMYVAGEDRLAKNALEQLYNSMQPMGLTKSAHPTGGVQIIPPFSLIYISMLHDYFMLRNDDKFIKQFLPGVRFILDWFIPKIDETGMLGSLPYWNHIDGGTAEFKAGSPPGIVEGHSAHMTILLAYTLDRAAEMLSYFGHNCDAENYNKISVQLKNSTMNTCYDNDKGLIAETPDKKMFSQHTNSFAILADMFSREEAKEAAQKIISDKSLAQTTLYFDFYTFQALSKAGLGGKIIDLLDKWKYFLSYGLTTFPEHHLESRSDCHAWAAHPLYDFLNITCGIKSGSPGFKSVLIKPQPGLLNTFNGEAVHPNGKVTCTYQKDKNNIELFIIEFPHNTEGEFEYKDKKFKLVEGLNEFRF
ncbi:MAG: alpha-L-rhamnosidase N-terminal domain-containing protein [Melioribacteraceae bacterium]|nr:alpha-L-rhamnosidase N-terminal domain-containing protein [Melioribacteraceae bacterium]